MGASVHIHLSPSNAQHSCFIIRQLVGSCCRVNVGDCRFQSYQEVGRCGSVPELHVAASLKQPTTSVNQLLWRLTCSSTPTTRGFQNLTTRPCQFYGVSFLAQWFCVGATTLVVQPPVSHCTRAGGETPTMPVNLTFKRMAYKSQFKLCTSSKVPLHCTSATSSMHHTSPPSLSLPIRIFERALGIVLHSVWISN